MFQTFPAILGWDLKSLVINYRLDRWYTNQTCWNIWTHIFLTIWLTIGSYIQWDWWNHSRDQVLDWATTAESLELLFSGPGVSATYSSLEWQPWWEWVTIEVRMDTNLVSFDHFGWCLPSTSINYFRDHFDGYSDTQLLSVLSCESDQLGPGNIWPGWYNATCRDCHQFTPFHPAIMIVCFDFWANEYQT